MKLLTLFRPLTDLLTPFAPLFLRLGLAWVFVRHGLAKIHAGIGWGSTYLTHLGIPIPGVAAVVVVAVETVGAACLALGLLTRFWAFCMAVEMVVAIALAVLPHAPELELLLLVGALALLGLGAGPISLDRLFEKQG
jgi:putative oxidoreductase